MSDFPDVKLKALLSFPADIRAGPGIEITRESGVYTINNTWEEFTLPSGTAQQLLQYDIGTNSYVSTTKVDLLCQTIVGGNSITIDRAVGEIVVLQLNATVTSFSVLHWPAAGILGKITLLVTNTGAFNIATWPAGSVWAGGIPVVITPGAGKKDMFVLATFDGGATVFVSLVAQDYH